MTKADQAAWDRLERWRENHVLRDYSVTSPFQCRSTFDVSLCDESSGGADAWGRGRTLAAATRAAFKALKEGT